MQLVEATIADSRAFFEECLTVIHTAESGAEQEQLIEDCLVLACVHSEIHGARASHFSLKSALDCMVCACL